MNIIQQLIADVRKHERFLEERDVQLKDELRQNRKTLKEVVRHRERLERDQGNGEATLPLAPPDDEGEEATDEASDVTDDSDPLVPDEWNPDYEVPTEADATADTMAQDWEPAPAEPEKPIRRRKAKAAAEEVSNG